MKSVLRVVSLALFIGSIGYWAAMGANRGWTKTSVPVKTLDSVTGLEGVTYQPRFIPGVDFLAVAAAVAVVLAGASFLFRTKRNTNSSNANNLIN